MTGYLSRWPPAFPITGWLTDRFGGRRILMVAIAVFTVASFALRPEHEPADAGGDAGAAGLPAER